MLLRWKFLNNFIFCNICKNILKSDQETCITPDCPRQTPSSKNKSFFMTADLTSQLKNILIKPDLWGSIQENAERKTTTITDITDGEAYLLLKKEGNFLYNKNNITLTLFTDGVPLFKSSGVCMWPVYLLINEVPRNQRFRKKNMLLWGVWQGTGKPMMTAFLKELIKDLSILYTEGLTFSVGNTEITSRVMLIVATMDLQARAAVLKMTQHNGEFACVYCLEKGK